MVDRWTNGQEIWETWGWAATIRSNCHTMETINSPPLTLCERYELAEELAEDEVAQQGAHQGDGHAEHAQEDVRDGQVEQKDVGDGAHAAILDEGQHHQQVAHDGAEQNDAVAGYHPDGHIGADAGHAAVRGRRSASRRCA